jgi:hypothetical protein
MEPRIFHGNISSRDIANAIMAEFNRGNLRTQVIGNGQRLVVQIATSNQPVSGGTTAVTVTIQKLPDGVSVQMGQQAWLGVAASLGQSAFWTWLNPWNIINRIDDIAQDIENLQLAEKVWKTVENTMRLAGVSTELSERLRRNICLYCSTGNPIGEGRCIACGAPMGANQPRTCKNCGFVPKREEVYCTNCGKRL